MMKAIAPVGWHDIATQRDLRALEARMDLRFSTLGVELRSEMRAVEANLRTELANGLRQQTYALLGGGSVLASLGMALANLLG